MSTCVSMPNIDRSGATPETVHVAVGLLVQGARVFVARRHVRSHQGGLWEFPGGKLAQGESVRSGLARELHEELGVEVTAARPYLQVRHRYADKTVLLDVWQIEAFRGEPHGREGQDARWADIDALRPSEFPDADRPILRRLQLPPLYLISDARRFGLEGFYVRLERALAAGARLVQLREPQLELDAYHAYASDIALLCHRYGAKLMLNANPSLVAACGADGVHLNTRRLRLVDARPLDPDLLVGASCHDREELGHAQRISADLAVLSPVRPTRSHPDAVTLGWDRFAALCSETNLPVYALGGMRPEDLPSARMARAAGVAMISGMWDRQDLEAAVAECS